MDNETTGELHKIRAETKRDRRRDGYFWLIMVLTAVGSSGLAILFSTINTNASERKFCAVVAASVRQADGRVQTYRDEPPKTPAGLAQQRQAEEDARDTKLLQRSLDCPREEEGSP